MNFSGGIERGYLAPELVMLNEINEEQSQKARITVCNYATDADEALEFLKMLGLA